MVFDELLRSALARRPAYTLWMYTLRRMLAPCLASALFRYHPLWDPTPRTPPPGTVEPRIWALKTVNPNFRKSKFLGLSFETPSTRVPDLPHTLPPSSCLFFQASLTSKLTSSPRELVILLVGGARKWLSAVSPRNSEESLLLGPSARFREAPGLGAWFNDWFRAWPRAWLNPPLDWNWKERVGLVVGGALRVSARRGGTSNCLHFSICACHPCAGGAQVSPSD